MAIGKSMRWTSRQLPRKSKKGQIWYLSLSWLG